MEHKMNWLLDIIESSIGKKLLMAMTGLGFCVFLFGHLAGNLTIYGGKDAFNSYAEHLHSLGPILTVAEIGLLVFAMVHILSGTLLFWGNFKARPQRYIMKKSAGGRTIGSRTMPYTGFLVLLFVIFHLMNFHFIDKTNTTIFQIVQNAFSDPIYVGIYVVAMLVVGIHVSHGFWSAFQTLGANHPKYMPLIKGVSICFSLIVGLGFGFLPIYFLFMS
jgi:succinate dehydrogenase / fumarate reductase, cytochrome b subunit